MKIACDRRTHTAFVLVAAVAACLPATARAQLASRTTGGASGGRRTSSSDESHPDPEPQHPAHVDRFHVWGGAMLEVGPSWYPEHGHGEAALHLNALVGIGDPVQITMGCIIGLPFGHEPFLGIPWAFGGHVSVWYATGRRDDDIRFVIGIGGYRYHIFEDAQTRLATTGGMLQPGLDFRITDILEIGVNLEVGYGLCEPDGHAAHGCPMLGLVTGIQLLSH